MKNEMRLDGYGVVELSYNHILTVEGGWSWPRSVDFIIDYVAGKVIDSLVDGFNNACTHGHTADPGSKLMHTALH